MTGTLTRNHLKARVLRALSGLPQEDFERRTEVEGIAGIENGSRHLTAEQVARMCASAGLTPEGCETLIQEYEAEVARVARSRAGEVPPRPERRPVPEPAMTIAGIIEEFETRMSRRVEEQSEKRTAERKQARDSWARVQDLGFEDVALLARTSREYRSWALVELICGESAMSAMSGQQGFAERARDLAALAVEIAGHVRASERWSLRLRGFAAAHLAKAQHAAGDPGTARKTFTEAERLWKSGENPDQVLDESRFAALKASLKTR